MEKPDLTSSNRLTVWPSHLFLIGQQNVGLDIRHDYVDRNIRAGSDRQAGFDDFRACSSDVWAAPDRAHCLQYWHDAVASRDWRFEEQGRQPDNAQEVGRSVLIRHSQFWR